MKEQYLVLHEDDDILVIDKIAPLPVQRDKSGDEDLQSLVARERSLPFLEAAHRIDRRTSGIVLFAKNRRALRTLEEAFRDRKVEKRYIACLEREPVPERGVLRHGISTNSKTNKSVATFSAGEGAADESSVAEAELSYRLVLRTDRYFFVEAVPLTGRHHQIRAQFAAAGWPIKGDLKYGARRSSQSGRIMLHARAIAFAHPSTGERIELLAPYPDDETLWVVFESEGGARD